MIYTKRHIPAAAILLIINALMLCYTIYVNRQRGEGIQYHDIINILFLIVMACLTGWAAHSYLRRARIIADELDAAAEQLRDGAEPETLTFQEPMLHTRYDQYLRRRAVTLQGGSSTVPCDLADYIHPALIFQLAGRSICEAMPGVLTGLGILGTFLGLTLGLSHFSTDYDVMQTSIMMLIDGIKTAFLTSIYGVVNSVVFNWLLRRRLHRLSDACEGFEQAFYEVVPDPQEEVFSRLLEAQDQQSKHTREFAETVTTVMGEQFQLSIDTLNRGVNEFMQHAITDQENKLRAIVREYLTCMNEDVFKGQLEQIRETLAEVSVQEKAFTSELAGSVETLCARETVLKETQQQLSGLIAAVDNYANAVRAHQEAVQKQQQQLSAQQTDYAALVNEGLSCQTAQTAALDALRTDLQQQLRQLQEAVTSLETTAKTSITAVENTAKQADTAAANHRRTLTELSREQRDAFAELTANSTAAIRDMTDKADAAAKMHSEQIVQLASGSISRQQALSQESSEAYAKSRKALEELISQQRSQADASLQAIRKASEQMCQAIGTTSAAQREEMEKTAQDIRLRSESLGQALGRQQELLAAGTEEMNHAAGQLRSAVSGLEKRVSDALQETAEQELELHKQFSGTLSDSLRAMLQELTASMQSMQEDNRRLIDALRSETQQSTAALHDGFDKMDSSAATITEQFAGVLQEMQAVSSAYAGYLQVLSEQIAALGGTE